MTVPPVPPLYNMAAYVLAQADQHPDKLALRVMGAVDEDWTYAAFKSAVLGTATGLLEQGLAAGDRILMRLGNTPDFPITYLAAIAADLIPIPTSAQLTAPEVAGIIAETSPALIVAANDIPVPTTQVPILTTETLRELRNHPPAKPVMGDPNRPAYIIYTSGTSGQSRAVVHAHRAIWARRMMWDGWYGLRPDDRMLHAGAFNWTYTLGTGLMDPLAIGATALIPAPDTDIADLPRLMAQHDATIFAAAPGVYRRLLREDLPALPHLRHGLSAGEKLPEITRDRWEAATGTQIHEAFGMSECSTFISGSPYRPAPTGTLGHPQTGRKVTLMGAEGPSDTGTIAIHKDDPGLMLGYLNQPAETAAKFRSDWFLTGDIGTRTPDGVIAYAGRADDMMNAGGYRVSPIEVETALARHPQISEVAAVALRMKADTSVIAAFYTGTKLLDEDLTRFAGETLAAYKIPRLFVHIEAIPRGANNKILRRKLRQDWETTHGQT